MAASVLVGLGLGYLLEKLLPWVHPWGLVGGLLLGAASGFWELFKMDQRLRQQHRERKNDKPS